MSSRANAGERYWNFSGSNPNEGSLETATREMVAQIGRIQGYQPNHDNIQASLQQRHIPKLGDPGVIKFDSQRQLVRYHEHERLETVCGQVAEFEIN